MITARGAMTAYWYTPKGEEDGDTKFQLKGLTALERVEVQTGAEIGDDSVKWTARAIKSAMKSGLVGWENFNDSDGKPVKFSADVTENISRFSYAILNELFVEIMTASVLDEGQKENL